MRTRVPVANFIFCPAPGNWDRLTLVLQRVLNRRLFVWLQFQETKIALDDASLPSFSFDGVTSVDLRNDALGVFGMFIFCLLQGIGVASQSRLNVN